MSDDNPLLATDFTPMDGSGAKRRLPISLGMLSLALLAGISVIIMTYLFIARAVIFQTEPPAADIEISGLSFNIGDNYLLLKGLTQVHILADGFCSFMQTITSIST